MTTTTVFEHGAVIMRNGGGAIARYWLDDTVNPPVLYYDDGIDWVPTNIKPAGLAVNKFWDLFHDFESNGVVSPLTSTASGTSAALGVASTVAVNRVGVATLTTGTTSAGRAAIHTATDMLNIAGGRIIAEAAVNLTTLSDGTDTYAFRFGVIDTLTGESTNGVYFEYAHGTSANWNCVTAAGGVRTKTPSDTPVAAGTWVNLRVELNNDNTAAYFYINDTLAATITDTVPASGQAGIGVSMLKSVGSTARIANVDWLSARKIFNTPRT